MKLPFCIIGMIPDLWNNFDRYANIDKNLNATYFFIPYKNYPGFDRHQNSAPNKRAAKYDIDDLKVIVNKLEHKGFEIALHGIDAWLDVKSARSEIDRINSISRNCINGVRMHWLYFSEKSHRILEDSGLVYDSTVGYNDSLGFKSGTAQAYKPLGAKKILEIPIIIQDSALFYPGRMNLNELEAWKRVSSIIGKVKQYGGALTINWHHRSLSPERLWGDFYNKLLHYLKQENVYFISANGIAHWFNSRRKIIFETIQYGPQSISVKIKSPKNVKPEFILRIYHPLLSYSQYDHSPYRDIVFSGNLNEVFFIDNVLSRNGL